jgi:hypothetical protein
MAHGAADGLLRCIEKRDLDFIDAGESGERLVWLPFPTSPPVADLVRLGEPGTGVHDRESEIEPPDDSGTVVSALVRVPGCITSQTPSSAVPSSLSRPNFLANTARETDIFSGRVLSTNVSWPCVPLEELTLSSVFPLCLTGSYSQ